MHFIVTVSAVRFEKEKRVTHEFVFAHDFRNKDQAVARGKEVAIIVFPPQENDGSENDGEWVEHAVDAVDYSEVLLNGKLVRQGNVEAQARYVPTQSDENPVLALARIPKSKVPAHNTSSGPSPTLTVEEQAERNRSLANETLPPVTKPEQIAALVRIWWDKVESTIADIVPGWNKPNLIAFRPALVLEAFMKDADIQKECQKVYNREHDIKTHATPVIAECCKQAQAAQA